MLETFWSKGTLLNSELRESLDWIVLCYRTQAWVHDADTWCSGDIFLSSAASDSCFWLTEGEFDRSWCCFFHNPLHVVHSEMIFRSPCCVHLGYCSISFSRNQPSHLYLTCTSCAVLYNHSGIWCKHQMHITRIDWSTRSWSECLIYLPNGAKQQRQIRVLPETNERSNTLTSCTAINFRHYLLRQRNI